MMKMSIALVWLSLLAVVPVAARGQEPTCKACPGTYMANDEIEAYLKRAMAEKIIDQQVRSVDVGKSNVAIGLVHRTKLATPGEVAEHDLRERGLSRHQRGGDARARTGSRRRETAARRPTSMSGS